PLRETASSLCGTIACPYWAAPTWSLSRSSTRPGRWLPPSTITNSATASGWCHLPASKDSPTLSTVGNWTTKESKGGRGSPEVAWPKASVVILNYNRRRYLDPCLDALIAQKLEGNFEVVVVDNASADGSVEHLQKSWPQVQVVQAAHNLGFAGGNNLGLRHSRGEHVVLLNNDTRVRPGWLRA